MYFRPGIRDHLTCNSSDDMKDKFNNCFITIAHTPENTVVGEEITSATNTSRFKKLYTSRIIKNRRRQKARGFKMLWLIVAVFLICWSPYFIFIFYSSIHHRRFSRTVKVPVMLLTFLNSALNPFLYGFLNGKFRSSLWESIGEKFALCKWKQNETKSRVHHINWGFLSLSPATP